MEKNCDACGSSRFRPSRFRLSDLARLFTFHYPVRCVSCQQRSYAPLLRVLEYRRSKTSRRL